MLLKRLVLKLFDCVLRLDGNKLGLVFCIRVEVLMEEAPTPIH